MQIVSLLTPHLFHKHFLLLPPHCSDACEKRCNSKPQIKPHVVDGVKKIEVCLPEGRGSCRCLYGCEGGKEVTKGLGLYSVVGSTGWLY